MPAFTTVYTCIVLAGVAVATAFCPIESASVTLPTEWPFGVTDTGSCYILFNIYLHYLYNDAWLIVSLREYCECTRSNGYTYPSTVCKNFRMIPINDN